MVGDTKRYRPSLLISQVGQLYRYAASIVDHADNAVSKVTQLVGHTGYVSVRRGDVIGVTAHPGTHALRVLPQLVTVFPHLHRVPGAFFSPDYPTLRCRNFTRTALYRHPLHRPRIFRISSPGWLTPVGKDMPSP